ncbi:MAG TPA: response regulator [Gemmatimonadaceae bacterium]|jgi:CheY-like chemotaxis protein|nr:response regulator [Gemmatimonadaceae bacterium]
MESPPHGSPSTRPHSRLFVIDDEPSIRAAIKRFLTRRGWEVEEAEDGRVALDILLRSEVNRYDVVMCDLRMPFVSGAELHRELMQKRPDLVQRLVFSTGDVASAEAARFLAESERPVMEKPFELSLLEEMLVRVRDQSHAIDAP